LTCTLLLDLVLRIGAKRPWMATRLLLFGWVYLIGETWAVTTLGVAGLLGGHRAINATYRLQRAWANWNFESLRRCFRIEFEVTGLEAIPPGPVLVLSRHASLIDTLLPATYVARPHGIRLRYVLKKELLLDPALDLGGNRLPNYFIDRGSADSEAELSAIRALATGLGPDDGIVIYPEGTRFSPEKLERSARRFQGRPGRLGEVVSGLRLVLPPRPGGTLALLEGSTADVVVLMHRGLEGFARVADIWKGHLVGTRVVAHFKRVPRSEIPPGRADRVDWLFGLWAEMDAWVVGSGPATEGA
jgi:1-acyl-sn-glycerol-3-phosphate acyltransferase